MRYKRKIIWFSCAFLITFLFVPIVVHSLSRDFAYYNSKQVGKSVVDEDWSLKLTSEHLYIQNYCRDTQHNINSKTPKKIVFYDDESVSATEFPIGWYEKIANTDAPAKVADEKINIIMPYVGSNDEAKIMAYLDTASEAGVKVVLELPRSMVRGQKTDEIVQFVRKFKNHPAVFAWYTADEPEFHQLSSQALENAYHAIKTEDSTKPVAVVFARLWGIEKYLDALDVFIWDQYPVTYGSPEFGGTDWKKMRSWFEVAASRTKEKKGFWFVMQGYGEKYDGTPQHGKRLPTYDEERYMLYSAVLSGIDGLFLYAHYLSQQSWIDSVLTPLLEEFHDYIPAIAAEKTVGMVKSDRSNVQIGLYRDPKNEAYYLIAINHGKRKLKTAIKLPKEITVKSVQSVNREHEKFVDKNNETVIKDVFTPYGVNIYKIN